MRPSVVIGVWLGTATLLGGIGALGIPVPALAADSDQSELRATPQRGPAANAGDHSGRVQHGKASYYGHEFDGRTMANGRRFRPNSKAAASKTLPLGTTARVTNLHNGRSTTVRVEDR